MLGIFHGNVCSSLQGDTGKQREKKVNYPKISPRLLPPGAGNCSSGVFGQPSLGNSLEKFGSPGKSKENVFFMMHFNPKNNGEASLPPFSSRGFQGSDGHQ